MKQGKITFESIYRTKIIPRLAPFEKERQKKFQEFKLFMIFGIISVILVIFFNLLYIAVIQKTPVNDLNGIIFVFCCFVPIGFFAKSYMVNSDFKKHLKENLLPVILSPFGKFKVKTTTLSDGYSSSGLITLSEISNLGLFCRGQSKNDDDSISGTYKNAQVAITECSIIHTTRSGTGSSSSTRTVIDFSGLIIKTRFNKKYKGKTILSHKKSHALEHSSDYLKKHKLERIRLEDPELDKTYNIFSNDQVEARYLLDLSFMEKFKQAKEIFAASYFDFVIEDDLFYIFINVPMTFAITRTKDFFEIGSIKDNIYDIEKFRKTFLEFKSIFRLIAHFDVVKEKLSPNKP